MIISIQFCPTNVEGYFYVHVPDYDCGIYSEAQTRKDKNGFGPAETLAIKQLATAPHGGDHKSWSFSKNKAAVLSLRRAVFNLHDETYVEVFEKQPLHPSNPQAAQPLSYRANGICSFPSSPLFLDIIICFFANIVFLPALDYMSSTVQKFLYLVWFL